MSRAPRVLFGVGAVVSLLTAFAHLAGQLAPQPPPASEAEAALRKLMETVALPLPGATRTARDLLSGFGLLMSTFHLVVGILSFLLLRHLREDAAALRSVAVVLAGGFGILLGISLRYFFFVPTAFFAAAFVAYALSAGLFRPR